MRILPVVVRRLAVVLWVLVLQPMVAFAAPQRAAVVTSDTLMQAVVEGLLPPEAFSVSAILPPGQCPGHYDVKLSDIERLRKAALVVGFRGMGVLPDMKGVESRRLLVETGGRNWMVPGAFVAGTEQVARELSRRLPAHRGAIAARQRSLTARVKAAEARLARQLQAGGARGAVVIASSLQQPTLEWMGLRVVGSYGRPETLSTQEVVRLIGLGKRHRAVLVVDNLQSGPDAGKGIAEALGVPRVVLTNFPDERGYLPTLETNVRRVIAALRGGPREPRR